MAFDLIAEAEAFVQKIKDEFSPERKAVENDVKAIVHSAVSYIETHGLQDLYALASALLTGAVTGTPWGTLLGELVQQGTQAGIQIAKGAEAVVLAQAQADLIAAGKLIAPSAPNASN